MTKDKLQRFITWCKIRIQAIETWEYDWFSEQQTQKEYKKSVRQLEIFSEQLKKLKELTY